MSVYVTYTVHVEACVDCPYKKVEVDRADKMVSIFCTNNGARWVVGSRPTSQLLHTISIPEWCPERDGV